jgi:uncharacterized protein YkwD
MGKRFVSGALVAALAAGMISISAVAASACTVKVNGSSTYESQFVSLINHERSSRGLNTLAVKSDLVSVARQHSLKMACQGYIEHDSSTWNSVSGWTEYGENVGVTGADTGSNQVITLHNAFMNSPEHKRNIIFPAMESNPKPPPYNQVGVGVTIDSSGSMYVTEIFVRRGSTTTTTTTTHTTTTHTTTTTTHKVTTYASRPVAAVTHAPAAPKPQPALPVAVPQTVDLLVRMVGLDADQVDPATGAAAGF